MAANRRSLISSDPLRVWTVWAPLLAVLVYWGFFALYGFNPTDDGFILAQSWRIVLGQIPHVEFTSPRPVGAGLLHVPEVLTPVGLLALDRLVVLLQFWWIAVAALGLLRPRHWSPSPLQRFLLVAAAFLLSTGVWPIMAWHTVDGLFIAFTAFWVATRAPERVWATRLQWPAVWLLSGFAPLIKQGFALVPLLTVLIALQKRDRRAWWAMPLMLLPGLLYLVWVRGNVSVVRGQLYSGSTSELLLPARRLVDTALTPLGLATLLAAVAAVAFCAWARDSAAPVRRLVSVALVAAPTLYVGLDESFGIAGSWSYHAVMSLAVVGILTVRTLDRAVHVLVVLGVTYASCMSWGVTAPSLMSGVVLALAVQLVLDRRLTQPGWVRGLALSLLALAVAAAVLPVRLVTNYREPARALLTASVDSPQFRLVKMSPQSAAYITSLESCLARYPAERVAVLPDGPGLYPLLRLENPTHADWWFPLEFPPDQEQRAAATVAELAADSSWLVLGQTRANDALATLPVDVVEQPGDAVAPAVRALLDSLPGRPVTCASFVGKYQP